jgi:hypothetical protein
VPRVAVVGCGDVSIVHFEAIEAIADGELVAVCDSDPATLPSTPRSSRGGWAPYTAAPVPSCGIGRRPTIRHGRGGVDGRPAGAV